MLTINIICVGKLKESWLRAAQEEYAKRLQGYCRLNIIELSEHKLPEKPSEAEIARGIVLEGKQILAKLAGEVIPMCIEGKQASSEELANQLNELALSGQSTLSFVIGGSFGLSDEVKEKGKRKLSMSKMTFPHQLARVMLLEQVYRAFSINANAKYHK